MADLTGTTPANTYKGLLQVNDYTDGIAGNTGSNALVIQDGAGNATALAISTDNVGIGTTSPARLLHLKNSNSAIAFETPIDSNGSAFAQIKSGRDGSSGYSSTIEFTTTESTTAVPTFGNNGSGGSGFVTRMLIDSSGNVGIGTTSPTKILHIAQAVNGDSEVTLHNNDVTAGSALQTKSLSFAFAQTGSSATRGAGAVIRVGKEQEWTSSASTQDGYLSLHTAKGTALNEAMRINSDGNVGIGTTSPDYKLDLQSTTDPVTLGLKGYGSFVDGSVACQILFLGKDNVGGNRGLASIKVKEHDHGLGTGSIEFETRVSGTEATRMIIASDGNVTPGADDVQDFGSASLRWDDIYATNTTIQSSDRELKQDIEELTEAETRVAQACKGLLRKYRWKSSVEEKGDEARIHFGIIAQDLEAAFAAEGLDAGRYGMFVKNTWWTADRVIPAVEAMEAVEAVYDEEGNEVSPAVEAVEAQPEKTVTDIFNNSEDAPEGATEVTQRGVRYSELLAFIIAAI